MKFKNTLCYHHSNQGIFQRALEREYELKLNAEEARQQARERSEVGNGHFNMSEAYRSVPVFEDNGVDMFFELMSRKVANIGHSLSDHCCLCRHLRERLA